MECQSLEDCEVTDTYGDPKCLTEGLEPQQSRLASLARDFADYLR